MVSMAHSMEKSDWRGDYVPHADQRVFLRGDWSMYETLLELRGDTSGPRMAFLDGVVELMSPSQGHESIKTHLGRLLEAYCLERRISFTGFGSWTLKDKTKEAGAEPDECYVFGPNPKQRARPDLAIEVVWTHGGIRKLEIYRRLGVREVWYWSRDAVTVYELVDGDYVPRAGSHFVPGVDLAVLCELALIDVTSDAILALRDRLRGS